MAINGSATSSNRESSPKSVEAWSNPRVVYEGWLTSFFKTAGSLFAITALAAAYIVLTAHGPAGGIGGLTTTIGGLTVLSAAGGSLILGIAFAGSRFRDRREIKNVRQTFPCKVYLQDLEDEIKPLKAKARLIRGEPFEVNGKRYMVEVLKGENWIERITLRNK